MLDSPNNCDMIKRAVQDKVVKEALVMPIITLVGPRQSGKTTLAKMAFPSHEYVSLEMPSERAAAIGDPLGFLSRFKNGVIIDEVQRVPDLLSYIQVEVDASDRPGRYILTGSQNLLLMQNVSQTLAGRTSIFTLLPFSIAEIFGTVPLDPAKLDVMSEPAGIDSDLWHMVWTGCYPRIHHKKLEPQNWLSNYHQTYVERDVRDVLKVMDADGFERFVRLAAAHTGQELNIATLASDVGISQPTVKQWLNALRVSYLVTLLPPHHKNYRKRMRKRPKLHFLDTGLVCYLLGITTSAILQNHPLRGAIFESFVVSEITKLFLHSGREAPLFHWRDATGHEVDIIVDLGDRLVPIEIKSGMTLASDVMNSLTWWTGIASNFNETGVLVHGGTACHMREGFCVRPWWLG